MPAPEIVHRLIQQFTRNRADYVSDAYNEAQLRQEFLNPFFEVLGWDVNNKQGFAVQYREVIHEDSIEVEGSKKAPDYAFRLGGVRKFFVEAKKPAENIETDARLAYQLRRYAWNAHLPLSILTDFEEFAVYDCRNRPDPGGSPATSRIMMIRYQDYPNHWEEIAGIFSPDAIRKGAFDRYAADNTGKKGTIKVDDAFLADIESWRTLLARNIALRNPQVADERQLNFAVQMIIDRIIFLRICEDRQIERENQLLEFIQDGEIYPTLVDLFQRADLRYNSGLFHFKDEHGETSPADTLTPSLTVDDKVLKEIIQDLYYPSPYIFNEIPVEILGQVYEQFLGRVIRLTPGHRAKVEEKPEVRKAGGVYYTPKYIVDYIVEHTVGKLLEGKTPKQAAELKIVDPACGSGSFLLGAFQYLLRWHEDWYLAHDPEKWAGETGAALVPAQEGGWRISTAEKKRILLNNIFGVDIDAQAVEVTKLSLLLKVLEGETGQLSLGFERVLPDLGDNIQCGNSLIGPDYYEGKQLALFSEDELYRINAFDWEAAFPEVFAQGGFDAVIGNPPYIKEYTNREPFEDVKKTHLSKYYQGKMDIWYIFACLSIDLLKTNGIHSFIATNNWITNSGASIMRKKIHDDTEILEFIDFNDYQVFSNASIQTMVYLLKKRKSKPNHLIEYIRINQKKISESDIKKILSSKTVNYPNVYFKVVQESLPRDGSPFTFINELYTPLLEKISRKGNYYLKSEDVAQGIVSPQDYVIKRHLKEIKDKSISEGDGIFVLNKEEVELLNLTDKEKIILKPYYTTKQLDRYFSNSKNIEWIIYTNRVTTNNIDQYPNIKNHLRRFVNVITSDNKPYGLHRSREERFFNNEKILSLRKTNRPNFSFTDFPCYVSQTYYVLQPNDIDLKYLLGVLNSKVIHFWLLKKGKKQGSALQVDKAPLLKIPIRNIDIENKKDKERIVLVIKLVNHMIDLRKRLFNAKTPNEKTQLQRQIDATDAEIDRLVYDLYGLTEEEIRIVEESVE